MVCDGQVTHVLQQMNEERLLDHRVGASWTGNWEGSAIHDDNLLVSNCLSILASLQYLSDALFTTTASHVILPQVQTISIALNSRMTAGAIR